MTKMKYYNLTEKCKFIKFQFEAVMMTKIFKAVKMARR